MTDQKHRNAYKRFWRNMRNAEQAVDQAEELKRRAYQSYRLARRAQEDMQVAR